MEATNHIEKTSQHTIPEGWREFSLGELGEVKMCKRVMKYQTLASGEIPFYKIGTFGGTPDAYISRDLFTDFRSRFSYPKKGDILLSAAGTIGRTVVFDGEDSYFQDSNIVWIDNKEDKVLNSLLYYCYKVMKFHTENGGIVVRLYNENLRNTTFCAPESLEEQKRIAEALAAVDNMIATLDEAIAKKRQIKEGLMQQLLTGKTRLPGFTDNWVELRFEDFISRFATGLNPRSNFMLNVNASNYYVTIKDFADGVLYFDQCDKVSDEAIKRINERSDLRKGDVLFSSIGRVGDAYVIEETPTNWNINESVFSLRPNPGIIDSQFLYYLIKSKDAQSKFQESVTGTTLRSIKMGHLKEIVCCFPSSINEQKEIAKTLKGIDMEIQSRETLREKYRLVKQGMMHVLLTGKTRL